MRIKKQKQQEQSRTGAAVVEFALVAPLFLTLVLGTVELGRALDVSSNLSAAVREGGRLASMDSQEYVESGSTANAKVISDIKNILTANGIDGTNVTVTITHADGANAGSTFDLEDSNNDQGHFKVEASVLYDNVSIFPLHTVAGTTLRSAIVLRKGRSALSD